MEISSNINRVKLILILVLLIPKLGISKSELLWVYPSENHTNLEGHVEVEDAWMDALLLKTGDREEVTKIKVFINNKENAQWKRVDNTTIGEQLPFWSFCLKIPLVVGKQSIKVIAYTPNEKWVTRELHVDYQPKKRKLYFIGFSPQVSESQFQNLSINKKLKPFFSSLNLQYLHKPDASLCYFEKELMNDRRTSRLYGEGKDGLFVFYLNAKGIIQESHWADGLALVFPCEENYTTCCETEAIDLEYIWQHLFGGDWEYQNLDPSNRALFILDITLIDGNQEAKQIALIKSYLEKFTDRPSAPTILTILSKDEGEATPVMFELFEKNSSHLNRKKNKISSLMDLTRFINRNKTKSENSIITSFITNDLLQNEPIFEYNLIEEKSLNQLPTVEYEKVNYAKEKMVYIKGDTFRFEGYHSVENRYQSPLVYISDFLISKKEVSFEEYDLFCREENNIKPYGGEWGTPNKPVVNISWYEAIEFCNWKSIKEGFSYDCGRIK